MAFKWDESKGGAKEVDPNSTFGRQEGLPRLPVPELKATLSKLLLWARPLADDAGYSALEAKVKEFGRPGGDGEKLQTALVRWADQETLPNWLEPIWDDGYLCARCPNPINVNFAFSFEPKMTPNHQDWLWRAAYLSLQAMRYKRLIEAEKVPVNMERGKALCMGQFKRLFGNIRVPHPGRDENVRPPFPNHVRHIAVSFRGNFFAVDVERPDGTPVSIGELHSALRDITANHGAPQPYSHLGVLTTWDREKWANARNELIGSNTGNVAAIQLIDSSLFGMSLDDTIVEGKNACSAWALHGDGRNRWYDKCFSFYVTRNGQTGVNAEHSDMDGHTVMTMLNWMRDNPSQESSPSPVGSSPLVRPVTFHIPDGVAKAMKDADDDMQAFIVKTQTRVVDWEAYGIDVIKKWGMSPDAFMQVCFQAAQQLAWGKVYGAYEPVMTKLFKNGRTEALRPVTKECAAFARILGTTASKEEKISIMKAATQEHTKLMNECKQGQGVDRHILGLLTMWQRHGEELGITTMPAVFSDEARRMVTHDVLSTSAMTLEGAHAVTFGPVVEEGLGLAYMIKRGLLNVNVTAYADNAQRRDQFVTALQDVFRQVQGIFPSAMSAKL